MAVKASMAPMNYDINGDEEDDDDNLLYEERWTVISRNDCLRESLVANVDEDYWESRRSNTGIASDKGDNFDSDDVLSPSGSLVRTLLPSGQDGKTDCRGLAAASWQTIMI